MSGTAAQYTQPQAQALSYADKQSIAAELETAAPAPASADPALETQAQDIIARVLSTPLADANARSDAAAAFENMGSELQKESARRSAMLKQPLQQLMKHGDDGGQVASSLIDLKIQVEALDPAKFDLEPGWITRTLGMIPGVGTPLKRYFSRYESAAVTLDAIVASLDKGREQLKRDNITLTEDQKAMRALTLKLEKAVMLARLIDQGLQAKLDTEILADDPRHGFIAEELLFPLRQRIQDLQQQLLVNQQGFLTAEVVIRNNKELIRGVNRATNVTVNSLQTAVTLALALANQQIVLDKIKAVNTTTENLIASTAERLKTQGADIHKQASSTQLNIDVLKKAFDDIRAALDDIARYRQEALPKMAQNILEMEQLADRSEQEIQKFEQAGRATRDFSIEIT